MKSVTVGRIACALALPLVALGWLALFAYFWLCIGWETCRDEFE